jgi:hypothetical protein
MISFVAKSQRASTPNNPAGTQSEKRSRCQALQSGSRGKHLQTSGFASLKIHAGIWLQPVNQADNAAHGSLLDIPDHEKPLFRQMRSRYSG